MRLPELLRLPPPAHRRTFGLAALMYKYFELPVMNLRSRRKSPTTQRVLG